MFSPRHIFATPIARLISSTRHKHTGFAYTGNPFETKITMKRQVQDLSYPDFEKQECLKWANWRMLRDVKRRYTNAEYWQYRNNLKNVGHCRTLPSVVRDIAIEDRNATPIRSSITYINNRCAISSRSRGKFARYRLSRIIWRDMADHGLMSGAIRAKWG